MHTPSIRSRHQLLGSLLASGVMLGWSSSAIAQVGPIQPPIVGHFESYRVRSDNQPNPYPIENVVFREVISLPPATPWLRLHFSHAQLGKGSYLRIASLRDGGVQTLNQVNLEQWSFGSAFFNGYAVMVEIVAGPSTEKNYLEIDKIWAGDDPATAHPPEAICFLTDDRTPSANPAVGRLMSSSGSCTGWIIDRPTTGTDRVHLSAGHCFPAGSPVLQFNVPASGADCSINNPPPSLQFAVDTTSVVSTNGGVGNDFAVFRCFPNPVTGLTTFQQQGAAITLGGAPGFLGNVQVFGFGADGTDFNNAPAGGSCTCVRANGTGTRHLTQQSSLGPLLNAIGTIATYQADICGGTSGGPVFHHASGQAFAINTHASCAAGGTSGNYGTLISAPAVQNAINTVAGRPSNDECIGAIPIIDGLNGTFTNVGTTASQPGFACRTTAGTDVWFSYVATCTGNVTFETCTMPRTFDTVLEVLSGDCNSLTSVACNDDTCGLGSSVVASLTAGQQYFVRVGGYNSATGIFGVTILGCGSANECAGAIPLQIGSNGPFANGLATTSAPAWSCANGGNDIWFTYNAPSGVNLTFSTCNASTNFDTALEVFRGSCGALTLITCNDDDFGCPLSIRRSRASISTSAPQTIFVRVGGFNGATGVFALDVGQSPTNDDCVTATGVTSGVNGPFSNLNAYSSAPAWPPSVAGSRDVWFFYPAPCNGVMIANTCSAALTFDTTIEVFGGSCAALTSLAANDDSCGRGSSVTVPVTAGGNYWIRVGGYFGDQGDFQLTLTCGPVNDECANAIPVAIGTNGPFSNAFATTSAPWSCAFAGNDVWFTYTAGVTAPHTFTTCTPTRSFDTTLQVFQGPCSALISIGCNDDACGLGSSVTVMLGAGVLYDIRVGGYASATGSFDLTVATGTNSGSITTLATGCGANTMATSGNPNIGGTVNFQLGNVVGVPFIGLGLAVPNTVLCPGTNCRLGSDWLSSTFGDHRSLVIPANAAFIGLQVSAQGAVLFAPGGCPEGYTVTDTAVVAIG